MVDFSKLLEGSKARRELVELIKYLQTDKFTAVGCDFVHIRTDLMPKLMSILGHLRRED